MDPITMAVLAASVLAGMGAASWAGLKAWNGWPESRSPTFANASASWKRSPPGSTSKDLLPRALCSPGAQFSGPAHPFAPGRFVSRRIAHDLIFR